MAPASAQVLGGRTDTPAIEEDEAEPFVPKEPATDEELFEIEAKKLYVLAQKKLARSEFFAALELLKEAHQRSPNSVAILRSLAELNRKVKQDDDALQYAQQAIALDPRDVPLLHLAASLLAQKGDRDQAIELLEQAREALVAKPKKDLKYLENIQLLMILYKDAGRTAGLERSIRDLLDVLEHPERTAIDPVFLRKMQENRGRLYVEWGLALQAEGRVDEALERLARAQASLPRPEFLGHVLAELYASREDWNRAEEELTRYFKLQIQNERSYELLAEIYGSTGRGEAELVKRLEQLHADDRHNPVLRRFYGTKLIDAGQFGRAREILEPIRKDPRVTPLLVRVYRDENDNDKLLMEMVLNHDSQEMGANDELLDELAKDPEWVGQIADLARKWPPEQNAVAAWLVAADLANRSKQYDLVNEFYARAVESKPSPSIYRDWGYSVYVAGQFEQAASVFGQAAEQYPGIELFGLLQARSLAWIGQVDEGAKILDAYIEKTPNEQVRFELQLTLGEVYTVGERWDQAVATYHQLIAETEGSEYAARARYQLSNVFTLKGDGEEAEKTLLDLIENRENRNIPIEIRAGANNDLGYLWADEGRNLERAEQMIRFALELKPDNGAYLDSLGWLLFKRGNYAEAVEKLEQASQTREGDDPVIWDHLGDAYLQVNNFPKAKEAWQKSIEGFSKSRRISDRDKAATVERKLQLLEERFTEQAEKNSDAETTADSPSPSASEPGSSPEPGADDR